MRKMKTPHDRFVRYLYARGKDPSDWIPDGLPISPESAYGKLPKRGKKYKEFLAGEDLENLKDRIGLIFDLWHTFNAMQTMTILIIRDREHLIPDIMSKQGKWVLSEEDIDLYKHLFFDIQGWNGLTHRNYLNSINDEEIYLNYESSLSSTPYEVLLFDLGADAPPQSADDVLNRLLSVAFHKFEKLDDVHDQLQWGKWVFSMVKEKKKEKDATSAQQVLDQLQIRLPEVATKVHELGDDEEIG